MYVYTNMNTQMQACIHVLCLCIHTDDGKKLHSHVDYAHGVDYYTTVHDAVSLYLHMCVCVCVCYTRIKLYMYRHFCMTQYQTVLVGVSAHWRIAAGLDS